MRRIFIEQTLTEKYPRININKHPWHQVICHTEFGPGWHDLIIELFQKIIEIYNKNGIDILELKIDTLKEKYGGLRVYVRTSIPEIHDLLIEYENKAEEICEECGKPGSLHEDLSIGWLYTVCNECASIFGYKKVED